MNYHQQLCEHYKNVRQRLSGAALKKVEKVEKTEPPDLPQIEIVEKPKPLHLPWADHKMEIVKAVAEKHGVGVKEIFGHGKRHKAMLARREVCWRLKTERGMTYSSIGRFVHRDHTTVMHAVKMYEKTSPG